MIQRSLRGFLAREDMARSDWKRQTDAVQIAVAMAQMEAEAPERFFLVDGRIARELIQQAVIAEKSPKAFFAKRCHSYGLTCRRIIFFDTKSGRKMGRRGNSQANLHFHGAFLVPEGCDERWLRKTLKAVFGSVAIAGTQLYLQKPDTEKSHSFSERQGHGVAGKLAYMLTHAGSTHKVLKLNKDGKRSRKAPAVRRRANKTSQGIAQGLPRHFVKEAVIFNNESKREARRAFDHWMRTEPRSRTQPEATTLLQNPSVRSTASITPV